jgi:mono/diheme cytochrome c family protein
MNKPLILSLLILGWSCGPGAGNASYRALSAADQAKFEKYMILGKAVYATNCRNCHQDNGRGLQGLIPPLAAADYLQQNQKLIPCLLKTGSKDSLMVNGVIYPPQMPAHKISNLELAEVLTFINNSWGNEFGFVPVKQVDELLENCK